MAGCSAEGLRLLVGARAAEEGNRLAGPLRAQGHAVAVCVDAPAFIERLGPLDLLLSDVGLPGLDGRQLADVARRLRPGLPVILMTGYAEQARIREAFLRARRAFTPCASPATPCWTGRRRRSARRAGPGSRRPGVRGSCRRRRESR